MKLTTEEHNACLEWVERHADFYAELGADTIRHVREHIGIELPPETVEELRQRLLVIASGIPSEGGAGEGIPFRVRFAKHRALVVASVEVSMGLTSFWDGERMRDVRGSEDLEAFDKRLFGGETW